MTQSIRLDPNQYVPYGTLIAKSQVANKSNVHKFGYNAAISTATETVWAYGGAYNWLAAATVLKITSNSTADDVSGTGALTVVLEGLDANYAEITETVILTGQVSVNTTKSYLRLHRMYIATAGTGLTNAGIIFAFTGAHTLGTPSVATTVHSTIAADAGQTLQAFYTVPADKQALLYQVDGTCTDNTNSITMTMRTKEFGGAWRTKEQFGVMQGHTTIDKRFPLIIPEKTDIEIQGLASGAVIASASFDLVLEDN